MDSAIELGHEAPLRWALKERFPAIDRFLQQSFEWTARNASLLGLAVTGNTLAQYFCQVGDALACIELGTKVSEVSPLQGLMKISDDSMATWRENLMEVRCVGDVYTNDHEGNPLAKWERAMFFVAWQASESGIEVIPLGFSDDDAVIFAAMWLSSRGWDAQRIAKRLHPDAYSHGVSA